MNTNQIVPVQSGPSTSWAQSLISRMKTDMANAPPWSLGTYSRAAGSMAVAYGEGAVVGGMLGTVHAQYGLDGKYGPVDGWTAALAAALGVLLSGHLPDIAEHAMRVGSQAVTVLAFRKSYQIVAHQPLKGGTTPGVTRIALPGKGPGVTTQDPIEVAARGLG